MKYCLPESAACPFYCRFRGRTHDSARKKRGSYSRPARGFRSNGQASSLVFRIIVRGSLYILKIITPTEDPTRFAADAAYTNAVCQRSFQHLMHVPDAFLQKFQAVNILPKAESEEFFARYAEVAAVYPHDDLEMVSSHNDLFKPDNILFDGQRVWLVDWEAAICMPTWRWSRILHPGLPAPGFVGRSIGVERYPNSGRIIVECGQGKSTWRTKTLRSSTAGFIGNGSYETCGKHDTKKHSESFHLDSFARTLCSGPR